MSKPTIAEFFDKQCDKHGHVGWAASHWDDENQQTARYAFLMTRFQLMSKDSVLDIGCGQGELYRHMGCKKDRYTGIDISPKMIAAARDKYPGINVEVGDVLTHEFPKRFDHVFASGLFGFRNHHVEDEVAYAKQIIEKMYSVCNMTVTFNMLSDRFLEKAKSFPNFEDFKYHNAGEILDFCLGLSWLVKVDHYLPYEFKVELIRD